MMNYLLVHSMRSFVCFFQIKQYRSYHKKSLTTSKNPFSVNTKNYEKGIWASSDSFNKDLRAREKESRNFLFGAIFALIVGIQALSFYGSKKGPQKQHM